jgi:hypothetical protein
MLQMRYNLDPPCPHGTLCPRGHGGSSAEINCNAAAAFAQLRARPIFCITALRRYALLTWHKCNIRFPVRTVIRPGRPGSALPSGGAAAPAWRAHRGPPTIGPP